MLLDIKYLTALMQIRHNANTTLDDELWEISDKLIQSYCTTRIVDTAILTELLIRITERA